MMTGMTMELSCGRSLMRDAAMANFQGHHLLVSAMPLSAIAASCFCAALARSSRRDSIPTSCVMLFPS
jgi:hypothetical protein